MKITFSGDICVQQDISDFRMSEAIKSAFDKSDFSFCCLEAPIIKNECKPFEKAGPTLCQHRDISKVAQHFTHVTLANNHIMDYGVQGLNDTIAYLKSNNISYAGAGNTFEEAYRPIILEKGGIKVAVLCLAEAQFGCCKDLYEPRPGYAWIFNAQVYKQLHDLKSQCNYVICFVHAGLEMSDLPLPEWRTCYKSLIDYGCDLLVGSHPHVIQGKEVYKGKHIYYSLGNFFFNCPHRDERWNNSLTLSLNISNTGIKIQELYTKFDNENIYDVIEITTDHLSSILEDKSFDQYIENVNKEVLKHWNDYYESYLSYPLEEKPNTLKRKIFKRLFWKYIVTSFKPQVSKTLLYHNMIVDTHRFAISRAISLIQKTY